MENEKYVDESWKEAAVSEKEKLIGGANPAAHHQETSVKEKGQHCDDHSCGCSHDHEAATQEAVQGEPGEINFIGYITSLAFQAMIFLGEIPNPTTHESEKNLPQAKLLIDTLALLREKTKGNLDTQEDNAINGYLYELQMKFVEIVKKDGQA